MAASDMRSIHEIALHMPSWPHDISTSYVADALDLPRCPDDPSQRIHWWVKADAKYRYLQAKALQVEGSAWTT